MFVDRGVDGVPAPIIGVDNERAGYLAGLHLLERERPIWVASNPPGWIAPIDDRVRGFRRALAEKGLPFDALRVLQTTGTDEMIGAILTRRILALSAAIAPFGLLAMNDAMARGCYAALREADVSIPKSVAVAVAGFGDAWGPLLDPPLSAVWLGEENWGRQAAATLAQRLRGENTGVPALVEPHFVTRGSCGANENFCPVTALLERADATYFPANANWPSAAASAMAA